MGVLSCDRYNCDNVMCDRHSRRFGYICYECFSQLLDSNLSIERFMETDKQLFNKSDSRRSELENEFILRDMERI